MKRFRKTIRDPETLHKKKKNNPKLYYDKSVDLHGLTSADAERILKNLIVTSPGKKILINHGKGEGVLRKTVRLFCSRDPRVKEMRKGEDSLLPGGEGITIIQL